MNEWIEFSRSEDIPVDDIWVGIVYGGGMGGGGGPEFNTLRGGKGAGFFFLAGRLPACNLSAWLLPIILLPLAIVDVGLRAKIAWVLMGGPGILGFGKGTGFKGL